MKLFNSVSTSSAAYTFWLGRTIAGSARETVHNPTRVVSMWHGEVGINKKNTRGTSVVPGFECHYSFRDTAIVVCTFCSFKRLINAALFTMTSLALRPMNRIAVNQAFRRSWLERLSKGTDVPLLSWRLHLLSLPSTTFNIILLRKISSELGFP